MKDIFITHHQIISPLGFDSQTNFDNLKLEKTAIRKHQSNTGESFYGGLIPDELLNNEFAKLNDINSFTKLEKMLILVIQNLIDQSGFKPNDGTGLIISTTKGNVDVLSPESPFFNDQNRAYLSTLGKVIQEYFGFKHESILLSNACVSGVLALSVGSRLIDQGLYEDVFVVSGDLISDFILSGFLSFQAISDSVCRPYSKNRSGINIGEAAAGAILTANIEKTNSNSVQIIGSASCNDANHISGPSRTGEGLVGAISSAIEEANISANEIDYISAHGTATLYNDEMESIAFGRTKLDHVPLNSLKGYYGHTFGSSGLLESIVGIISINSNTLIPSYGYDENGVTNELNIIKKTVNKTITTFLKTASGFGGCNTAILIKKLN